MTGARGFVSPIPLTEREIDGFQLRTAEGAKLDDPTLGFTIGEFVEVTEGPNAGERGAVRLVRNGMGGGSTLTDSVRTSNLHRRSSKKFLWIQ